MSKIVQYKQKGSKVWLSYFKIGLARTDKEAIATAKRLFVNSWKSTKKNKNDAKKMVKKMVFKVYKP